ncbi:MAG TPA: DUF1648 domain-containing protein [Candidatus Binataceae bacterium]|nr:DUF1648 domain-containing protein [Candidatus Binataceae bacterium]
MKLDPQANWPAIAILCAMFAMALSAWPAAPAQLPIHWDASGRIDEYGNKFSALLLIPILATAIYFVLEASSRLRSSRIDAATKRAFASFKYAILFVMAGVYAVMAAAVRGIVVNMNLVAIPLIALLLIAAASLTYHGIRAATAIRGTTRNGISS